MRFHLVFLSKGELTELIRCAACLTKLTIINMKLIKIYMYKNVMTCIFISGRAMSMFMFQSRQIINDKSPKIDRRERDGARGGCNILAEKKKRLGNAISQKC